MMIKEDAFKKIADLVARFEQQYDSYKKSDYNETLTRRDFIDPFFKALGWDVDNENGYAETYREVIHEDKVKVGKATKAPDYSFRLAGSKRLFFVEAKKPSVVVKDDILPAYQVRRYGWNAKLAVSVVTDFEEFAIYDCTKKPRPEDKASVSRIKYLTFRDYLKEFDFLWDTFSKEQVLKGSFDKFVSGNANKKGTTTVDSDFLQTLDTWRTYLATSISWNNKNLDEDEINYTVQQTIDRIIFLRIAEGRDIEPYENLKNCIKSGDYYQNLYNLFRQADEKYNSGLFNFQKDKISQTLRIDNKVIKSIINQLYYPESPYEFSVLSVEILGTAYEQFLGKVIRITPAHHAKIEEKPEVRKAGGVYYTPQYIVDYIVKNTVGKLIEGKTPKEISEIKIVDPACGSGSFLIGAYQFLLDWHKNYYSNNSIASKGNKENPLTPVGSLTTAEKKRILLNNIFGVDLDVNAVEVTKLSLLLKCLEGETEASIATQLRLFNDRVLPTLDNNIKCGNSLIDTDFYDNQLDFGFEKKIKPFDWVKAFPDVFKHRESLLTSDLKERMNKIVRQTRYDEIEAQQLYEKYTNTLKEAEVLYGSNHGFDIVIGNPPYFSVSVFDDYTNSFLFKKYKVFERMTDIYCLFFEKAINILRPNGVVSFITSNQWLQTNYGKILRRFIYQYADPQLLVNFGGIKVFQDATVDTSILQIQKSFCKNYLEACHFGQDYVKETSVEEYFEKNKLIITALENERWTITSESNLTTKEKIKTKGKILKNWNIKIYRGVLTGLNDAFIINTETKERLIASDENAKDIIKPILRGRDVHKFYKKWAGLWLISTLPSLTLDINKYPSVKEYLIKFGKTRLQQNGESGSRKKTNHKWFETQDTIAYYHLFDLPKLIYPETTVRRSEFFLDKEGFYIDKTCFMITGDHLTYLNGVLSSKLMEWFLETELRLLGKRSIQYSKQFIEQVPVVAITDQNMLLIDDICKYSEIIYSINKELEKVKLPDKIEILKNRIEHTENRINRLVYELYDLTEDEIKIVEGK